MKPITQEWFDKAEGDFATAQREIDVENNPNYDAVCFQLKLSMKLELWSKKRSLFI